MRSKLSSVAPNPWCVLDLPFPGCLMLYRQGACHYGWRMLAVPTGGNRLPPLEDIEFSLFLHSRPPKLPPLRIVVTTPIVTNPRLTAVAQQGSGTHVLLAFYSVERKTKWWIYDYPDYYQNGAKRPIAYGYRVM